MPAEYICHTEDSGEVTTYDVSTADALAEAKRELAKAQSPGLVKYEVFVGEPDGLGDSHGTGRYVWVDSAEEESEP